MKLPAIVLSVLAGGCLGAGFLTPALWPVSLVSFFIVMAQMARTHSVRAAFGHALLTGIVAYGISFHPLFIDAYPFDWLGLPGITGFAIMTAIWAITVLTFALPFGVLLALAWRFRTNSWMDVLLIPSAFVIGDWLGAWVFSVVNYGPFALLGPNFSMGSPGYQLAESGAFLQVAWVGSIYALCFVQAFIGVLLYRVWASPHKRERIFLGALGISLLAAWALGTWHLATEQTPQTGAPIKIALVTIFEPAIFTPSQEHLDKTYEKITNILSSVPADVDVVVLPEDSRFLRSMRERGDTLPMRSTPVILDSASTREDGALYARIEHFDAMSELSQYAYKLFLMPLGEEHPYLYQFALRLVGQSRLVDALRTDRGFETKSLAPPLNMRGVRVAALLCSEGMSPFFYAAEARMGAQLLFNLSAHTWFHNSRTMHTIAKWNSAVRAVESRRWYARSGDASPSLLLDSYGRTVAEGQWGVESAIYGTAYPRTDTTPYVQLGQRVLLVPIFILVICALLYLRERKAHNLH